MNDAKDDQELSALTDQSVTISLGGKSYTARRASVYDLGLMYKYRNEHKDDPGVDMDATFFIVCELLKPFQADLTPESLAKSIPAKDFKDVISALNDLGFPSPQDAVITATEKVATQAGA